MPAPPLPVIIAANIANPPNQVANEQDLLALKLYVRQLEKLLENGAVTQAVVSDWNAYLAEEASKLGVGRMVAAGGAPANINPALLAAITAAVNNGITAACGPGGAVTNAVTNGITAACGPGGAVTNAITAACGPGGAVTNAITAACGPGGAVTNGITAACGPGGAVTNLMDNYNRNVIVRLKNSRVAKDAHTLTPLYNPPNPPNFPPTLSVLRGMTGQQLNPLLLHYGLPVNGQLSARKNRLLEYLGADAL
jgi:hypothetical protein